MSILLSIWDLNSDSQSRKRIGVPDKYPTECASDSPDIPYGREIGVKYVTPVRQTFEWLKCAVILAAHNVSAGVWNKGVMEAYLRTCSIAGSVRDNIWNKCRPITIARALADEETGNDGEINDGFSPLIGVESNVIPKIWSSSLKMMHT